MKVPDQLRAAMGKREIRRSLKTRDHREAKKALPLEMLKARAELDEARRKLAVAGPLSVLQVTLAEDDLWGLMSRWFVSGQQHDSRLTAEDIDTRTLDEELSSILEWEHAEPSTRQAASKLLSGQGINLDQSSPSFRRLQELIQEANAERQKRLLARFSGRSDVTLNPELAGLTARSEIPTVRTITLGQLVDQFSRDPSQVRLRPKTLKKRAAQYRLFKEHFGAETRVHQIGRDDVRAFRDILMVLPKNAVQRFERMPLRKLLELTPEKRGAPLEPASINSYLTALGTLFDYGAREAGMKAGLTAKLMVPDMVRAEDKRSPFSTNDLRTIFSAPLFVGCVNDGLGYASPGPNTPRRGRFWVPLISLFTGLRLGEVCQLTEDDIIQIGAHALIRVTDSPDGTKHLKTPAARRNVPVHAELVRLGFLAYVAAIRSAHRPGTRLFPELTTASTGYASDNFSKWFRRFLDGRGIVERRKVFHSFRHSFADRLRAARVPKELIRQIGGWAGEGTDENYGKDKDVLAKIHSEEIAKMEYPELDLSALYPA